MRQSAAAPPGACRLMCARVPYASVASYASILIPCTPACFFSRPICRVYHVVVIGLQAPESEVGLLPCLALACGLCARAVRPWAHGGRCVWPFRAHGRPLPHRMGRGMGGWMGRMGAWSTDGLVLFDGNFLRVLGRCYCAMCCCATARSGFVDARWCFPSLGSFCYSYC